MGKSVYAKKNTLLNYICIITYLHYNYQSIPTPEETTTTKDEEVAPLVEKKPLEVIPTAEDSSNGDQNGKAKECDVVLF